MTNLSKKLSVLVATVMVATSVFAGCGSKTSDTSTTTDSGSGTATKALTPYVLDWYFIGNGPQADTPLIETEANKLISDINVTLKMHCFDWGTYQQKMSTMLASSEKVDLLMTAGGWGSLYFEDVRKAQLVDITDLAPKFAPNAVKTLSGGFWETSRVGGKNYALPVNKEKAAQVGFEFNKAIVDKYKFDITTVKSFDDLEPLLKAVKAGEPAGVYGLEPQIAIDSFLTMADDSVAGTVLPHDSTDNLYIPQVDNKHYIDVITTMRKYFLAGYIRKDAATVGDVTQDRKSQQCVVMFDSLKPGKAVEVSTNVGYTVVQQNIGDVFMGTNDATGTMMSIPKSAKDPSRVLQFMDKMYTDTKLINLIDYGIEGKHYVKVSDQVIDFAPETDGGKKSGYNPGTPWMFGDQFKSYLFKNEDPKKWEAFKAFNDSAKAKKSAGFAFNDESVKNEVAACNNVSKEFAPSLAVGAVDPVKYLPEYKAKLKAAGIDKIVAEVNKQYKDWQATAKK